MGYTAEKRKNKKKNASTIFYNSIIKFLQWLPLYTTMILLPFVVHYKLYRSRLYGEPYYTDDIYNYDFNLYYRQFIFLVIAGVAAVLLVSLIYRNRREIKNNFRNQLGIWIPLGIYIVFAFLSSICSEYRYSAFAGSDGQFQSFFVLLGYCILTAYLFYLIQNEKDMKYAGIAFAISMALQALLGVLQFFGFELLDYNWYQELITPKGYVETVGVVTNEMPDMLSLCLNNPNYAGVLLAVFAALCFGMLLTEKTLRFTILEIFLLTALLIAIIGTDSAAAILVFTVLVIVALVFRFHNNLKKHKWFLAGIATIAFVFFAIAGAAKIPVLDNLLTTLSVKKEAPNPLSRMVTEKDGVEITYQNVEFIISIDTSGDYLKPLVYTKDGVQISLILSEDQSRYLLEHKILGNGIVTLQVGIIQQLPAISINMNGCDWRFVLLSNSGYRFLNPYSHLEKLEDISRFGFEGYERLATNRGLLWSMALPLLKDTFFLGAGANNFIRIYPQNNYKDIYYYYEQMLTNTKPHNMYLQTAIETGVVSLIALLAFWGLYLVQSVRLYWNCRFDTLCKRLGFSCMLAVLVYLGCGLTNDSMISVAPIFWCTQGVGLAANWINRQG